MNSISFIIFCEIGNHDVPNKIRLKYILPFSTCMKKWLSQPFLRHCLQLIPRYFKDKFCVPGHCHILDYISLGLILLGLGLDLLL